GYRLPGFLENPDDIECRTGRRPGQDQFHRPRAQVAPARLRRTVDHHGVAAARLGDEADPFNPSHPCLHGFPAETASSRPCRIDATPRPTFRTSALHAALQYARMKPPCDPGVPPCPPPAGHSSILLLWKECFTRPPAAFFCAASDNGTYARTSSPALTPFPLPYYDSRLSSFRPGPRHIPRNQGLSRVFPYPRPMKTFSARPRDIQREWYLVDGTDQVLGRLASAIALRLRGKHKAIYTPHMDTGDFIIVTNVDKIRVTGSK